MSPGRRPKAKPKAAPRASSRRAALARPGDPLITKEGERIEPDSLGDIGFSDPRPMDVSPSEFRAISRRDLEDLLAEGSIFNACAAVFCLTILGISEREIQLNLKITQDQLQKIRDHEGYSQIMGAANDELINVNSMSMQSRIAGMAHGALSEVFHIARFGKKDETRLTANRDILDRAGTSSGDQASRNGKATGGLRITVVDGETTIEVSDVSVAV